MRARWLRHSAYVLCAATALIGVAAPPARAGAAPPVAPPGYARSPQTTGRPIACPAMPLPVTGPLQTGSKYDGSGPARDTVNPDAEAAYRAATATINAFEADVVHLTDAYMKSSDPADLACLTTILRRWADAKALQGPALDYGGKSIRKWALASAAGSYLRLVQSPSALQGHSGDDAAIRAWLAQLATIVMGEWDLDAPVGKINNQTYWAGWSVMAVSVIAGRNDLFDWALRAYRRGLAQVDGDGDLPSEVARGSKALAYHNYALQPLAMLAAFAKANDQDSLYPGALDRLARRTLAGLADPTLFEARTGIVQNVGGLASPQAMVWLEPFCWHSACTADENAKLAASRPLHANRLGGTLTGLFGP